MKQYIVSEENSSFERAEKEVLFFYSVSPILVLSLGLSPMNILPTKPPIIMPYKVELTGEEVIAHPPDAQPTLYQ